MRETVRDVEDIDDEDGDGEAKEETAAEEGNQAKP